MDEVLKPPKYKESFFHPHPDPLPSREREEYGEISGGGYKDVFFDLDTPVRPEYDREAKLEYARKRADRERVRLVFDPSGSPLERGESNKEDPLTFRLALNEG